MPPLTTDADAHRASHQDGGGGGSGSSGAHSCRFLNSEKMIVLALCEVVNSAQLIRHSESIWTHLEEDHVVTRMLFVFEHGFVMNGPGLSTLHPGGVARIQQVSVLSTCLSLHRVLYVLRSCLHVLIHALWFFACCVAR